VAPKLSSLINKHLAFYDRHEKKQFDKARRFYRGDYWSTQSNSDLGDSGNSLLCSKNLVYAIADTAVSALLGPNPAVAANPRNPRSEEAAPAINGFMNYVFQSNNMRRRAATALVDAVLCKRGIFKTGWSSVEDKPVIRAIDPSTLFFDLTVRDPDDIRYWLEATVMPWSEFKERVASGRYQSDKLEDIRPDRYPKWMLDKDQQKQREGVRDSFQWVTVWEYYDRETNIVQHYVKQADAVVFEDKIDYIPYSMFSLNHSGVDCLGLSEVQLILDQQQSVNDLLTHWKQITYLMIPRIMYDAGRITEEDLNKAVEATTGAFVGISPENSETLRNLGSLFYPMPLPEAPMGVKEFVARQEDDAAFVSALAEAARGQVTGARTATEMAIIDAQMRNRLATREGHLNDAIADVAAKSLYLSSLYMSDPKVVRVTGEKRWDTVTLDSISDVEVDFEMATHHPMQKNPGVVMESILQLLPVLTQSPHIDVRKLMEEIVHSMGMPASVLTPAQDAALAQAAAQQQQMLMSGAITEPQAQEGVMAAHQALGGEVPMGAEGPLEASPEEALAAGGGAPIRDAGPPAEAK
jgi:hypothetical protein